VRPNGFEWLIILAIVVILFGATKLPQIAKGLGESIRVFKKEVKTEEAKKDAEQSEDEKSSK
jgi:sec-independent protein translocase protein TatA